MKIESLPTNSEKWGKNNNKSMLRDPAPAVTSSLFGGRQPGNKSCYARRNGNLVSRHDQAFFLEPPRRSLYLGKTILDDFFF